MLYGPANKPSSIQAAREGDGVSNHPPSGAMATGGRRPKAMTRRSGRDERDGPTRPSDRPSEGEPMATTARCAPLPESPAGFEADTALLRMTPMTAATSALVLVDAAPESQTLARARAPEYARSSKEPPATMNTEPRNHAEEKVIRSLRFFVRITAAFQPRWLMMAPAAAGCKRLLDSLMDAIELGPTANHCPRL